MPPASDAPGSAPNDTEAEGKADPSRAILVQPDGLPLSSGRAFGGGPVAQNPSEPDSRSSEERLEEAQSLCHALGLTLGASLTFRVTKPKAATLFGGGHVETIKEAADESGAQLVVVNAGLTPLQQRNLERAIGLKVMDRVGLIIEIFGQRAQTSEGKLQVELAAQTYQRSRLVRAWSGLDRQRGGRGMRGGPGEMQLELDRRRIDDRIIRLKKELAKVRQTRALHRKARERAPYPVVVLVGYTNAGKSTLFNALTTGGVMAKDMLFATLDPTHRRLELPGGSICMLVDSVGFVADLPTELIEAFKATLEEVENADLILHLRDLSHPNTGAQRRDVLSILLELIGEQACQDRVLEVGNKVDRLDALQRTSLPDAGLLTVSAINGQGLGALLDEIQARIQRKDKRFQLVMRASDGAARARVYQIAHNVSERGNLDAETLASLAPDGALEIDANKEAVLLLTGQVDAKGQGQLEQLLDHRPGIRLSYL